ncbi:MAG: hypothetical protein QM708_08200 [Propioniciclava sp.]|uniref:hypothetical protein n=1 Tax=Propioniciclava sp. TaxID=2038686 RepID=UPI0039E3DA94
MSVLVLASASGAPGVTTTALGLALSWPREVVLVDADRSASHAVLAGYLAGQSAAEGGVHSLLQAHRERRPLVPALLAAGRPLPVPAASGAEATAPRFVSGFTHLGSIDLYEGVWPGLVEAVRGEPFDLIVDAGRTGHHGLPAGLVAEADAVALVCRSNLVSLAGLRLHLGPLLEAGPPGRVGLILVGPGRPYAAKEVADQFGVPVMAAVGWDPASAAELSEGAPLGRGWMRSGFRRSLGQAAQSLADAMGVARPAEVAS